MQIIMNHIISATKQYSNKISSLKFILQTIRTDSEKPYGYMFLHDLIYGS